MPAYEIMEPFDKGYLKVSTLHNIYYEQVGNPHGQPILFIHGGPGGGIDEKSRRFFDPKYYRVILFDQRGCGKSTPSAEIKENTTWDLVKDIEKLREHLKIEKWILFGGSWGSTLSLIYAINYPEKVEKMILRGIYLGRKIDEDFLYYFGASKFYPKEYEEFISLLNKQERKDIIASYYKLLNSKDQKIAEKAAYHWTKWELGLIYLNQIPYMEEILADKKSNLEISRLEAHYFYNDIFVNDDNYILKNIKKIEKIPTIIIHGRYDLVCSPDSAYVLAKNMKNCQLRFTNAAGHSASDNNNLEALIQATDELKNRS